MFSNAIYIKKLFVDVCRYLWMYVYILASQISDDSKIDRSLPLKGLQPLLTPSAKREQCNNQHSNSSR